MMHCRQLEGRMDMILEASIQKAAYPSTGPAPPGEVLYIMYFFLIAINY